jgi:glutathione S-transferase
MSDLQPEALTRPILIAGAIGSPYTRKMRAIAIYRRIPYRFLHSAMPGAGAPSLPKPPLPLLPCVYLPEGEEGYRATSDSTFQLRELERLYSKRSVIPSDPATAFLDYLVEDYADEWVTKMMFHYRWGPEEGVENASQILPLWNLTVPDAMVEEFRKTFAQRQIDRLSGVVAGSLEVTGPLIEASYRRLIAILRDHFKTQRFTFSGRPSAGDFGLHGQLTQLVQVEPTSMALARAEAPRLLAWVDVVDDLSGLEVTDEDWLPRDGLPDTLRALFAEIGSTYAPFMVANAAALESGAEQMEFQLDGVRYWQRPFPYQKKCLTWLREEYAKLSADDRAVVDGVLANTGCEVLVA